MLNRRRAIAAFSALAMSLSALAGAAPVMAQDLTKATLRLKWLPQAQFAGFYVAVEKGYYKDEGIDLTINPGGPNLLTENLVATGADTFGLASGTEGFMAARDKNLPILCIGVAHQVEERRQVDPFRQRIHRDSLLLAGELHHAELRPEGRLAQKFRIHRDEGMASHPGAGFGEAFCGGNQRHGVWV